jgi:hypothetical protein
LGRKDVHEFLDRVYERAVADEGANPGRTAKNVRECRRAVLSRTWEQERIDARLRLLTSRGKRDAASRNCLTKAEFNAVCFATLSVRKMPP